MFPTFISILDIQSWWEVPSIAHFCSLFRTAFNLLDFDIEDLEEALLTDGTEESSWLQELIVRLLSGCLPNNEISTSNYQMFLRRLFRQKCQEHDRYNPFNTDVDFQCLPLRTKVDILHALCDFRLDADDVLDQLKNLEADSLRVEPLGYDNNDSAYWYFYGTRLYREDFKTKNNKKKSVWQVICFTEDDWFQLNRKFKKSDCKTERQLYRTLSENFLPELPRLFREKEKLARKRLLENLPRRSSRRIRNNTEKIELPLNKEEEQDIIEDKLKTVVNDKRRKSRDSSEDSQSDNSCKSSYEMAGTTKTKKTRSKQGKTTNNLSNNKDTVKSKRGRRSDDDQSKSSSSATTVGRQTNNSLSAATGPVVIQSVANTHKKKLKTSQVFRQTDEDLLTGMHKILDYVKNHEDAWPFADPVDEEYAPNYYSVIRKPMDLQKMEEKLEEGMYKNFEKFRDDFQLIVDNCRLYNGVENEYTEMVGNLLKVFEYATKKFLDQISSSDDEIAVEYPDYDSESKEMKKKDSIIKPHKRKPTLAAKTDKKRERSLSEMSKSSYDEIDKPLVSKKQKNNTKKETTNKRNIKEKKIKTKKEQSLSPSKKNISPIRSTSPLFREFSASPPPSEPPSSPLSDVSINNKKSSAKKVDESNHKIKKTKLDKFKDLFEHDGVRTIKKDVLKPKEKHNNKLRETIEKLKAKSEISSKLQSTEFDFELDTTKENKNRKNDKDNKNKHKKSNHQKNKKHNEFDDNKKGVINENNKKSRKNNNNKNNKNVEIEALTLATEQTLKDINKWLDGTPKYTDFSSASNSPLYPPVFDDLEINNTTNNKVEEPKKKLDSKPKKDPFNKDIKRRNFSRDPSKFLKRREIQRTIDRLQPGKSKGNLISTVQNTNKTDELFPLGPLIKKDSKNSLIVKTDDNAPKLSLGSVLDSFGRHKFVDESEKNKEEEVKKICDKDGDNLDKLNKVTDEVKEEIKQLNIDNRKKSPEREESNMMSGATPNLSAWFKAFGTPKIQCTQKKIEINKEKDDKCDEFKKETSPDYTTHGQPTIRQRKISTGSSVSERSSFSQDMDSPRVGIDERLSGVYPAPYPSPLHKSSPSGASPRSDVSPKSTNYPPFNGQIRVGFYQDTASNKSSPDKSSSCSPRDNPQSPYTSEHVYIPNTTQNLSYSYANSPYYSHTPNYSNSNPSTPYNQDYYDTNKSLTDQYQAKSINYIANSPLSSNPSSPSMHQPQNSSPQQQQHSPNIETFRESQKQIDNNKQNTIFPVKKRVYNEIEIYNNQNNNQNNNNSDIKYMHQNISELKPQILSSPSSLPHQEIRTTNYPPYNYVNEQNFQLNIPSARTVAAAAGNNPEIPRNMVYNQDYGREVNYARLTPNQRPPLQQPPQPPPSQTPHEPFQNQSTEPIRYPSNPNPAHMPYQTNENQQQAHVNNYPQNNPSRQSDGSGQISIPRTPYNIEMDQLRGNISNLSHIVVDRYNNEERIGLSGLQQTQYYSSGGDKGPLGPPPPPPPPHIFNKPIPSSSPVLPMFNQQNMSFNQNISTPTTMYNRQMTELQSPMLSNEKNTTQQQQQQQQHQQRQQQQHQQQQQQSQQPQDKKIKKRKSSKNVGSSNEPQTTSTNPPSTQGFQSYAGLKSISTTTSTTTTTTMEPSAISLKTTSVVPGSAFNFGPTPSSLSIGTGLYGDKDAYPNFLEDFRSTAPNYYMAAAAAAHHHAPSENNDKQSRHQNTTPSQPPGYPSFLGAPQSRPPPGYPPPPPLGAPFMPSQAQLMDAGSPLYQHYVLNQGLLGPPGPYAPPPGYHPALSMRQPYDTMTRPSWL